MNNFFRIRRTTARSSEEVPLAVQEERQRRRICRSAVVNEQEFGDLPRFGPLYSTDEDPIMKGYKEDAWKHLLEKTVGDESETTEKYSSALRDVESKAKDSYLGGAVTISDPDFRAMMLNDGCFLLQLIILILGGSSQLGYPQDHAIFGNSNDMRRWLKSIFYVGNQIPLVVLRKLMEQPFFQQVLGARKWEEPTDLLTKALYELLLVPSTHTRKSYWPISFPTASQGLIFTRNSQSSDLLDSLHSFHVIGTRKNPIEYRGEDIDLELGDGEHVHEEKEFPSATELHQAGIRFKNVKGMGSRGIYLKSDIFCSVLYMPTFIVDDNTEMMFQYLKSYEMAQQSNRHKRELCAYLKFMSELIRTTEDVKLLTSKGIIKAEPIHKENLPTILNRLAHDESCRAFRHLRLQINEYSRPRWGKLKELLSVVVLLSALQTIFTILSYFKDRNPSGGKAPSPA